MQCYSFFYIYPPCSQQNLQVAKRKKIKNKEKVFLNPVNFFHHVKNKHVASSHELEHDLTQPRYFSKFPYKLEDA